MTLRRLAAIVVLDVVGYSKMMAEDEAGTHASMKAHRNELDPVFLNHGGRIVKGTGDGVLVEVSSAVEAVDAAVEVQRLMAQRNGSLPPSRRMQMRIGVNLGDVIVEDDGDIYGDGVNMAARLEGISEPGGVCVSDSVHVQVAGRVAYEMEDLGEVVVKNIPGPVKAWRVVFEAVPPVESESAATSTMPTVAVLPFSSTSHDTDEYLADGIADDLITALSRYRDLRVVARSSSLAMRDRADLDVRDIARELDATYVVQGGVRRSGDRIRVSSRLVDAETGHHLWADRFDRRFDDIFEVQDEIVDEIASHIHPNLERREVVRRLDETAEHLDAWDTAMRARHIALRNTPEALAEAIRLLEDALQRDPESVPLLANLAGAWTAVAFNRWSVDDRNPFRELYDASRRACDADPHDPFALAMLAMSENYAGKWDTGAELARRALSTAPHDAMALTSAGQASLFRGEHDRAVESLTEAWRLAQHEPWRFHVATNLAFAHYLAERYDAAWAWSQQGLEAAEYLQLRAIGAAALGQLGRTDEARHQLRYVIDSRPSVSVESFLRNVRWKRPEDVQRYREGLVKAGLRE